MCFITSSSNNSHCLVVKLCILTGMAETTKRVQVNCFLVFSSLSLALCFNFVVLHPALYISQDDFTS